MTNLLATATAHVQSLLNQLQVKRLLTIVLVGFLVLTINVNPERQSQAVTKKLDEVVHRNDSDRPKTTGEWNKEARETQGKPGQRGERIAKETGEAVKEFGSLYPNTAERSADGLQQNAR